MIFPSPSAALFLALGLPVLVRGQTFTSCDPTKKGDCPPDPAIGGSFTTDFTQGADTAVFSPLDGTALTYSSSTGALFQIQTPNDAPTIQSNKYMFFGELVVVMQAAPGPGIVTSIVLQSDDLDEIDYELVGGDQGHVQTNYFSKGNTTTYDRGATYAVDSPMAGFHTYSVVWTAQNILWKYDGAVLRTLNHGDAYGGLTYPQTPMRIKLGIWVAGKPGNPQGTIDWSGGLANFNDAPFKAFYKSITVTDYSNGVQGATVYTYGDRSGTFGSINIGTGPATNDTSPSSPAPSSTPQTTTAPSSTPTPTSTPTSTSTSTSTSSSTASSTPSVTSATSSTPTTISGSFTTAATSVVLDNAPTNGSSHASANPTASPSTLHNGTSAPSSGTAISHMAALAVAFFMAQMLL